MLVLGLRSGESITIGPDITICRIPDHLAHGHWKIGIDAPRHVQICRESAVKTAPRVPMDNSPGNPTPVSPAAKVEGRIDL
jgi:carbon storage regulator CsrA